MPHDWYSEITNDMLAKILIKLSWLLIMTDQKPFINPIADYKVSDRNYIQNWATSRVHPCHPHWCEHPSKYIWLPHVLACIHELHILIQNALCIYSICSFLDTFASSSIHDSGDLSHSPKWKFWKMRNEHTQKHCKTKLGSYDSIPFGREISILTLKETKEVKPWYVKVKL